MSRICDDPCRYDVSGLSNAPTNATDPSGNEIRLYVNDLYQGRSGHVTIAVYDNRPGVKSVVRFYDGGGPGAAGMARLIIATADYFNFALHGKTPVDPPAIADNNIKANESPLFETAAAVKLPDYKQIKSSLADSKKFQDNKWQVDDVDVLYAKVFGTAILSRKELGLDKTIQPVYQLVKIHNVFNGGSGPDIDKKTATEIVETKLSQIPIYGYFGPNSNTWARELLKRSGFDPGAKFLDNAPGWDVTQYALKYGGEAYDANGNPLHKAEWRDSKGILRLPNGLRK